MCRYVGYFRGVVVSVVVVVVVVSVVVVVVTVAVDDVVVGAVVVMHEPSFPLFYTEHYSPFGFHRRLGGRWSGVH